MSRKLLAILAALLIAASLCACNDNEENSSGEGTIDISDGTSGTDGTENVDTDESGSQITPPSVDENDMDPGDFSYTEKNDKIYVLVGGLNLRTADYQKYTSVEKATELKRTGISTDENGRWSRIEYEGQTLYVSNKFTTTLSDLDAGFTAVEKTLIVARENGLKCHIAPEEDYDWQAEVKIVHWFVLGDEVKVVMENASGDGWYKVEYSDADGNKAYGYVYSNPDNYESDGEETTGEETTAEETSSAEETTTETEATTSAEG